MTNTDEGELYGVMRPTTIARILRIELRRSGALAAALLSLLVLGIYDGHEIAAYVGDVRSELALLIPLALGVGAWQARRDRRSRTLELLTTTPRPTWQRLLPTAGALAIAAVSSHVVIVAGVTGYAAAVGQYVPPWLAAPVAVTAVYLAAAVWLGLAAGRTLPWVTVPPLLVVLGFVVTTVLAFLTDPEGRPDGRYPATWFLNPGLGDGFNDFETLTAPVEMAQASWAVALAVACLLLCLATRHVRLLAVMPVALGLTVALALLPRYLHEGVMLDRGSLALVCTPDTPRVCARRVQQQLLDELRDPGRESLAILSAKLPQAPSTVVATYQTNDSQATAPEPDADVLYADVYATDDGRISVPEHELPWFLLMGAGTLACDDAAQGPDSARYFTARVVAAAWLLGEEPPSSWSGDLGALPSASGTRPAYQDLLALPDDEQRARVAALREAELACDDSDRLDILVGDRARSAAA